MKQYIIHLKIEDYDPEPKEKKEVRNLAILKLRDKSKALILKQLEVQLKAKEIIHVKNDSPLPFVVLQLDESKLYEQVDFLRKLDVVEMIEVDYNALIENQPVSTQTIAEVERSESDMFETSDKFSSLDEMEKHLSSCPFCKKVPDISGTYNQRIYHIICKDDKHHYECRAQRYKYARKTFYRLAKERLDISALHIYLSREHSYDFNPTVKSRRKTWIQIVAKHKGGVIKKYSPARFNKLFNPTDIEYFMKKLESISKAVVLMG